jgi:hypothetical protein
MIIIMIDQYVQFILNHDNDKLRMCRWKLELASMEGGASTHCALLLRSRYIRHLYSTDVLIE